MGTPPQKVTHFIEPHENIFQFKRQGFQYNQNKFNSSFIIQIEKEFFSLYYPNISLSYVGGNYFSDNYTLNTYKNNTTINIKDLQFTIYVYNRKDVEKYGRIGLFKMPNPGGLFTEMHSFSNQLYYRKIIDKKVFSFIYENNDNDFFNNIEKLETIVVGENSYQYNSKLNKSDIVNINSNSNTQWTMQINEIKFTYNNETFIEENIELKFDFSSKFIKGSEKYNKNIENCFFKELINLNLCEKELVIENKYSYEYEMYVCNNTKNVEEQIKKFPTLYFVKRNESLVFIFTYKDLFKLFNDRLYFMVIFNNDKKNSSIWEIGEIFLLKYIIDFNLDLKSISFYKSQIDEAHGISNETKNNNDTDTDTDPKKSNFKIGMVIEIIIGMIIVSCIFLIYRKYRKYRRINATQLENNNYIFTTNDISLKNKLIKELK